MCCYLLILPLPWMPWKTEPRSCEVWHQAGHKKPGRTAIEFTIVLEGIWQLASCTAEGHALVGRTFTLPGAAWSPEEHHGLKVFDEGTSKGE